MSGVVLGSAAVAGPAAQAAPVTAAAPVPAAAGGAVPLPVDAGRGVRARVREHRLDLLRTVLADADGPLTNDEVVERLRAKDGVGIPRRTLLLPPFQPLVAAQAKRRGTLGELAGTPWRLRRLTDEGRWDLLLELERRADAMRGTSAGASAARAGGSPAAGAVDTDTDADADADVMAGGDAGLVSGHGAAGPAAPAGRDAAPTTPGADADDLARFPRLALLRAALAGAPAGLTMREIAEATVAVDPDGVGLTVAALGREPCRAAVMAYANRRHGAPRAHPERVTALSPRACIDAIVALEAEVAERSAAFAGGLAALIRERYLERRAMVQAMREAAIMAAYRGLRRPAPFAPPC